MAGDVRMSTQQHATEGAGAIVAKLAPPASVSVATFLGVPVSTMVLWATLIYTVILIGHKVWSIYKEIKES